MAIAQYGADKEDNPLAGCFADDRFGDDNPVARIGAEGFEVLAFADIDRADFLAFDVTFAGRPAIGADQNDPVDVAAHRVFARNDAGDPAESRLAIALQYFLQALQGFVGDGERELGVCGVSLGHCFHLLCRFSVGLLPDLPPMQECQHPGSGEHNQRDAGDQPPETVA